MTSTATSSARQMQTGSLAGTTGIQPTSAQSAIAQRTPVENPGSLTIGSRSSAGMSLQGMINQDPPSTTATARRPRAAPPEETLDQDRLPSITAPHRSGKLTDILNPASPQGEQSSSVDKRARSDTPASKSTTSSQSSKKKPDRGAQKKKS